MKWIILFQGEIKKISLFLVAVYVVNSNIEEKVWLENKKPNWKRKNATVYCLGFCSYRYYITLLLQTSIFMFPVVLIQ